MKILGSSRIDLLPFYFCAYVEPIPAHNNSYRDKSVISGLTFNKLILLFLFFVYGFTADDL